jgi:NADPH-ferrihemoprotein reductase
MQYEAGDHIAVYAHNSKDTVLAACAALRWDPETSFSLSVPPENPEMLRPPFPCPVTVEDALTQHCELLQHPDKACLALLAMCAADAGQADKLWRLSAHEGKDEYADYVLSSKRSLVQVLEVCPFSCLLSLYIVPYSLC